MKISQARQAMNKQLDILTVRRHQIQEMIKQEEKTGSGKFDRIELSKELEVLDKTYEETFQQREKLNEYSSAIHNAQVAKQQTEAEIKANEDQMKCMEIFRRIANGEKVPPQDEKKLMEYDSKMYMTAKSMSVMHRCKDPKEHESLWQDEEEVKESPDAREVAENTEVNVALPAMPEVSAAEMEFSAEG